MSDWKLFIDDLREPQNNSYLIARSSKEAIQIISATKCPNFISFDHDLGGEDTAMAVVHFLIEKDLDSLGAFIPENFSFYVHSANPVGKENIVLLSNYLSFRNRGA